MNKQTEKYFGAANSFCGFTSLFHMIFNSEDYSRIYVIKGGPGTGKNSMMRNIREKFKDFPTEEIYCSSDPKSLDGIIITNSQRKIAVIDGTSPHERDANIPGAIDEIINLADNLDTRFITAEREKILSLVHEKQNSYKTAYSYLKIAGEANAFIDSCYKEIFDIRAASDWINETVEKVKTKEPGKSKTRYISSFGKLGIFTLDNNFENSIDLSGDIFLIHFVLDGLKNSLVEKGLSFTNCPSPLSPTQTEAIVLNEQNLIIGYGKNGKNVEDFFMPSKIEKARIKQAEEIAKTALEEATRWFSIASDFHFRLEEIYSRAMNFDKNNKIIEEKIEEIGNILF